MPTLYLLIGLKGAGKTHIGTVVALHTEIAFLQVESIWFNLKPGENGWKKVEEAVNSMFETHDQVMIESLGAGDGFRGLYSALAAKYVIKMIRVNADPNTCLSRVKNRKSAVQIPVSEEKVIEYNQLAALVSYPWDLEIDNNIMLSDAEILAAFRSKFMR